MAKEQPRFSETRPLLKQLDQAAGRAGVSRGQAFEDWLELMTCALGRPLMEDDYMAIVPRYADGQPGKRAIDTFKAMFHELIEGMTRTGEDLIGDLFESSISHGEAGQFLTPSSIARLMAGMQLPSEPTGLEGRRTVGDCCCGSGRMLLAAAEIQPNWHFIGQDTDLRCVRMTSLNLALRNCYGHVIWGNSLTNERRLVYETGRVEVWGSAIRRVQISDAPASVQQVEQSIVPETSGDGELPGTHQLELFD